VRDREKPTAAHSFIRDLLPRGRVLHNFPCVVSNVFEPLWSASHCVPEVLYVFAIILSGFPPRGPHFAKEFLHVQSAAFAEDLFRAIRNCNDWLTINRLMPGWSASSVPGSISDVIWKQALGHGKEFLQLCPLYSHIFCGLDDPGKFPMPIPRLLEDIRCSHNNGSPLQSTMPRQCIHCQTQAKLAPRGGLPGSGMA
jgi:hypothetical protein